MKLRRRLLAIVTAFAALAQSSAPGQPVTATVDASKTGPPISPYIYGQFLEHAGNLIYSSLWSEMLEDRKFYYKVMPKPPEETNAAPRGFGPGRWNPIGPIDSVVMDTNNPYVGDHSPVIKLAGDEPHGIRQTGVNFARGVEYKGRIQIGGDPSAKASVSLVWGDGADATRQTISLGPLRADYKEVNFSFKADKSPNSPKSSGGR